MSLLHHSLYLYTKPSWCHREFFYVALGGCHGSRVTTVLNLWFCFPVCELPGNGIIQDFMAPTIVFVRVLRVIHITEHPGVSFASL